MKIAPPPIREIIKNGIFGPLWVSWFNDVRKILTDLKQVEAGDDADAINSITLNSGSDQVDIADFNNSLDTLISEINQLKDTVNEIWEKLKETGLME